MNNDRKPISLVLGANGFLGSHICKQLAQRDDDVRMMVRKSSDTRSVDELNLPKYYGDVMNKASLVQAMQECDVVYYCVVDTRAWLKDTAPLYRTNIDGLKNALDTAVEVGVDKFVFTSSIVTIGLNPSGIATEDDTFNWHGKAPDYVRCRVQAEHMLLDYCRDYALPGVAMCVANTYGPGDFQPTPHGELIKNVAFEKLSLPIDCYNPVVDIRDAAQAMILASEKGRSGERYIVAGEHANQIQLFQWAAEAAGVEAPKRKLSIPVIHTIALVAQSVLKLVGKRTSLNTESVLLSHVFNEMNCQKAKDELGWQPRPIRESIRDAVDFYLRHP